MTSIHVARRNSSRPWEEREFPRKRGEDYGQRRSSLFLAALLTFALAACGAKETNGLPGYVESDALMMAAEDGGRVSELAVEEGDQVKAGALLFRLDPARAAYSAEQAAASAAAARERAAKQGALAQAVAEAEAQFRNAEINYQRAKSLYADKVIAKAKLDADRAAYDAAKARLDRARAERTAAENDWSAASASEDLARQRLTDTEVRAPAAGSIERIYRRPGEVIAPGEPVLALLPPENVKIRFYAPETKLATLKTGEQIAFTCDACSGERIARISFIAREPQYTPPLIYSFEERQKLVFLVEARPDEPADLRPGLPVSVRLK